MPAETLEDAYNALDPRQPITPEQVDRLFVARPNSPVRKIEAQLELSDNRLKLLFVGHRGSGKSSEMAYLSTLLAAHFLSVPIPLYNIFKSPAGRYAPPFPGSRPHAHRAAPQRHLLFSCSHALRQ